MVSANQAPTSQRQQAQRQQRTSKLAVQSARAVQRESGHGSFAPYQAIILAEFVLAELLVAATPIATRKNIPGLSPYVTRDMTKLLAIGITYFLLSLLSIGGTGPARFGAWFGGLILLAVGVNEASNIVADIDAFAGFTQKVADVKTTIAGGGGGGNRLVR